MTISQFSNFSESLKKNGNRLKREFCVFKDLLLIKLDVKSDTIEFNH